jgi:hypothetical protein
MISHVRTPIGLKPTWKGNLLLLFVAMLISASITFCLRNNMVAGTPDDARQMASAKLPASSQVSVSKRVAEVWPTPVGGK